MGWEIGNPRQNLCSRVNRPPSIYSQSQQAGKFKTFRPLRRFFTTVWTRRGESKSVVVCRFFGGCNMGPSSPALGWPYVECVSSIIHPALIDICSMLPPRLTVHRVPSSALCVCVRDWPPMFLPLHAVLDNVTLPMSLLWRWGLAHVCVDVVVVVPSLVASSVENWQVQRFPQRTEIIGALPMRSRDYATTDSWRLSLFYDLIWHDYDEKQ